MAAEPIVAVVVVSLDDRVLDRPVHALDLAVGPWMVRFGEPMLDPVGLADHVEAHWPGIDRVSVSWLICELDSIVCQDRVDAVAKRLSRIQCPGVVTLR